MNTKLKTTPWDFFLHLGIVVTIYTSAVSLLQLLFQMIDYSFPDRLAGYGDPYSTELQIAVAILIIIFPLYLFLSRLLANAETAEPGLRELSIRKWLLYLTLFVAGIAVAVDLIMLVRYFLSGEITARFTLKVLSVILVAGGIFWHYLADLRRSDPSVASGTSKLFASVSAGVVLVSIIGSFFIMGSPMTARAKRFDAQRVSDLQNIQWQIVNNWQTKGRLPNELPELEDSISGYRAPIDPETDRPYEYALGEGTSFKICGEFSRSNGGEKDALRGRGGYDKGGYYPSIALPIGSGYYVGEMNESWEHDKGRFCFPRTIDKERYPVNKTTKNP